MWGEREESRINGDVDQVGQTEAEAARERGWENERVLYEQVDFSQGHLQKSDTKQTWLIW